MAQVVIETRLRESGEPSSEDKEAHYSSLHETWRLLGQVKISTSTTKRQNWRWKLIWSLWFQELGKLDIKSTATPILLISMELSKSCWCFCFRNLTLEDLNSGWTHSRPYSKKRPYSSNVFWRRGKWNESANGRSRAPRRKVVTVKFWRGRVVRV